MEYVGRSGSIIPWFEVGYAPQVGVVVLGRNEKVEYAPQVGVVVLNRGIK